MKKHPLLNISSVLGIIIGSCSFFLSFFFMDNADSSAMITFRYLSSFEFFIAIVVIILSSILLGKNTKSMENGTFKVYGVLNVVFSSILLLLQISSFFVSDFENDEFEITFVMVTSIVTIIALVLLIYGLVKTMQDDKPGIKKQLNDLKDLFDKGIITQEEYEEKRKSVIEKI